MKFAVCSSSAPEIIEAALSNTFIISSNCPNGPNEILSNGKNGLLFKNNNLSDLLSKFDEFKNLNKDQIHSKKILAKKKIKMFTQFAHFNSLKKIINLSSWLLLFVYVPIIGILVWLDV